MKTEIHPAHERGHANHGWLDTWHSFSFADYFNPVREHFGALRVLNDDVILGGTGFGEHPHNNMEIISIPLSGELEHLDSMGHKEVIGRGDVQVMSAGTGIRHAEYNHSASNPCNFLQIWIYTRTRNVTPRYDQVSFDPEQRRNAFQLLVTPDTQQEKGSLWIHQDAWISRADLEAGQSLNYDLRKKGNFVFVFVIDGEAEVGTIKLSRRDAIAIRETGQISILTGSGSDILVIEVPER